MGAKRRLNGTSKVNRRTHTQTDTRTNRLIESIGPEGRCFENSESTYGWDYDDKDDDKDDDDEYDKKYDDKYDDKDDDNYDDIGDGDHNHLAQPGPVWLDPEHIARL